MNNSLIMADFKNITCCPSYTQLVLVLAMERHSLGLEWKPYVQFRHSSHLHDTGLCVDSIAVCYKSVSTPKKIDLYGKKIYPLQFVLNVLMP